VYSVLQDFWHGARIFSKAPGFCASAVIALAMGMGATAAIFSVVDAVLWKALPFRDPERLLVIWEKNPALNRFRMFVTPANYRAWRESQSLDGMAAILSTRMNLGGGPSGHLEPEEVKVERVSASLFRLLGVAPILGRSFAEEEDQPGSNNYALVSYGLWKRRLGGDRFITGRAIQLGNRSYSVVGVLPPEFSVLDPAVDVWLPLGFNFNDARAAAGRFLVVIARLKERAAIEQARAELDTIGNRREQADPASNTGWRPSVFPLLDELVGKVQNALAVLMAAVGFLLLMACANVANLLLARGTTRRKEVAVRAALGATRARIMFQLLSESIWLALAGGAAGLFVARGALAMLAWLGTESIPRMAGARLDARVFAFAFCISVTTGVLFGMIPALRISGTNLNPALVETARGGTAGRSGRLIGNLLVIVEVALAVVVLIASGLLIRSFAKLRSADPGFHAQGVLTFRLPSSVGRAAPDRRIAFFKETLDRMAALPGIRAVGVIDSLPLRGLGSGSEFTVEGRPASPDQRPVGLVRFISPAYFRAMEIPLVAGREFTAADTMEAPPVIIVNQTVARRFWPSASPIGGRIAMGANGRAAEIVGVVGDVKSERMEGEDWPTIYLPYSQSPPSAMAVVVRTGAPPLSLVSAVTREIHAIDPDQPVAEIRTMQDVVEQAIAGSRFNTAVLGVFAVIAFVLAAVGIYGVISYDVSQRTKEIGIRMALGAQERDVLKLIVGQGAKLAAWGIAAGLAAAFALTRLMEALLFGVKASDANTFAMISLLLGAVALAASYLPSRRAMALDPVTALRHE
jgi:putative ABC transport system permease protein